MNRYQQYEDLNKALEEGREIDCERLRALCPYLDSRQKMALFKKAILGETPNFVEVGEALEWREKIEGVILSKPGRDLGQLIRKATLKNNEEKAQYLYRIGKEDGYLEELKDRQINKLWIKPAAKAFFEHQTKQASILMDFARDLGFDDPSFRTIKESYKSSLGRQIYDNIDDLDQEELDRLLNEGAEPGRFLLETLLDHDRLDWFERLYDRAGLNSSDRHKLFNHVVGHRHYDFVVENGYADGSRSNLAWSLSKAVKEGDEQALMQIAETSLDEREDLLRWVEDYFEDKWTEKDKKGGRFLLEWAQEQSMLDDVLEHAFGAALHKTNDNLAAKLQVLYEYNASLNMLDPTRTDITGRNDLIESGFLNDYGLLLGLVLDHDNPNSDVGNKLIRSYNQPESTKALSDLLQDYKPKSLDHRILRALEQVDEQNGEQLIETWVRAINEQGWELDSPDNFTKNMVKIFIDMPPEDRREKPLEMLLNNLPLHGEPLDETYEYLVEEGGVAANVGEKLVVRDLKPSFDQLQRLKDGACDAPRVLDVLDEHMTAREQRSVELSEEG